MIRTREREDNGLGRHATEIRRYQRRKINDNLTRHNVFDFEVLTATIVYFTRDVDPQRAAESRGFAATAIAGGRSRAAAEKRETVVRRDKRVLKS